MGRKFTRDYKNDYYAERKIERELDKLRMEFGILKPKKNNNKPFRRKKKEN